MSAGPLLSIEGLRTYFFSRSRRAFVRSVDGADLSIARGETLGVVGESGSGKSVTALSVMGLVSGVPGVIEGRIDLAANGTRKELLAGLSDCVSLSRGPDGTIVSVTKDTVAWERRVDAAMAGVRGKAAAMIFQNPKASLNPFMTVGAQIAEAVRLHTPHKEPAEARERALHWLESVRMDSPRQRLDNYPRALSGGMCQRAMVAMALAAEPAFLIADEPTTGLDATIQSKIADLLDEIKADLGITTMLISHDIGLIRRLADRVAVMYAGMVVESGPAAEVLSETPDPGHPYTGALLRSVPGRRHAAGREQLAPIPGEGPDAINLPNGCRFYGRCDRVTAAVRDRCAGDIPPPTAVSPGRAVRCWLRES